jgi:hypothetical protein
MTEKLKDSDTIIQLILRHCLDAWTIHDYSTGGSSCLEHFADMVEDEEDLYTLLDELGIECNNQCNITGEELSKKLKELAKRKQFEGEDQIFEELSKVLHALQQVTEDVNKVFDAVSQELYRVYRECSGDDLKRRVGLLIENLKKGLGRGSEAVASGYEWR